MPTGLGIGNGLPLLGQALFYPDATLAFDFTTGSYRVGAGGFSTPDFSSLSGLTVSRASVGYAERQDGTLVQFGNNVARITDKGLLVEESRTNTLANSIFQGSTGGGVYPTGWGVTGSQGTTISTAAGTVLGVTTNIASHRRVGAGGVEGMQPSGGGLGLTTGVAYTFSAYYRVPTGVTAEDAGMYFGTGTPSQATLVTAATLNAQPKDIWVRYSTTVTFTVAPSAVAYVNGNPASVGNGWDIALPQAEQGSFVLSFIGTTGASATRAADSVSVGGLSIGAPHSLVVGWNQPVDPAATAILALMDDGTTNNVSVLYRQPNKTVHVNTTAAGVAGPDISGGTASINVAQAAAGRIAASNYNIALNGVAATAALSGSAPNTLTALRLGMNLAGAQQPNAYIRKVLVYPSAFSDAQLQSASQ